MARNITPGLSRLFGALADIDAARLQDPSLGYSIDQSQSNRGKNRWSDIPAYDHALLPGPYLNAALIPPFHPSLDSLVLSQAPLPATFVDFYRHLMQKEVNILVNLTALRDGTRVKSDQYWPEKESTPLILENGLTIFNEGERTIDLAGATSLTRRALLIHHGDMKHLVYQFHLASWPDQGTFPSDLLLLLMDQINKVRSNLDSTNAPIWYHCSAGIGRSGTLACAMIAQDLLLQKPSYSETWDLPTRIVEHLRRYRPGTVQTLEQFKAVHELVTILANKAGIRI